MTKLIHIFSAVSHTRVKNNAIIKFEYIFMGMEWAFLSGVEKQKKV